MIPGLTVKPGDWVTNVIDRKNRRVSNIKGLIVAAELKEQDGRTWMSCFMFDNDRLSIQGIRDDDLIEVIR